VAVRRSQRTAGERRDVASGAADARRVGLGAAAPFRDSSEAERAVVEALADPRLEGGAIDLDRGTDLPGLLGRLLATARTFEVRMRRAERESMLDPLTGLANRRAWRDGLRAAEERARRGAGPAVVAVLDLDGFKEVNDAQGHAAGDRMLRRVAATLEGAVRAGDLVARTGGDEFAVLAFMTEEAAALAARLDAALAEAGLAASVGAADRPPEGTLDDAWHLADEAMYAAKARRSAGR
jgi:diguanylate cyclase